MSDEAAVRADVLGLIEEHRQDKHERDWCCAAATVAQGYRDAVTELADRTGERDAYMKSYAECVRQRNAAEASVTRLLDVLGRARTMLHQPDRSCEQSCRDLWDLFGPLANLERAVSGE